MTTWLHYYNADRPGLPSLGSVRVESRYLGHYYITKEAYKRAMAKIRQRDGKGVIAFRGPGSFLGEEIAVITYYVINSGSVPCIQIIGKVEGVY